MSVRRLIEEEAAAQGTGIRASVADGGQLYITGGDTVTDEEASERFLAGDVIHAPNAGSGSFRTILSRLGFDDVKVWDWSSSAGDWVLIVNPDDIAAAVVYQSNRHPNCGFSYSYNDDALELFDILGSLDDEEEDDNEDD